ncbi:MAG: RdgB/HAM1 family non-canonical purine NTP pyrophosphatase [Ignavibacteriales bacterium]|nr:RdgB/HAM1 family non-canonical purine NTP pyrophosphatase [Ignavibacteriales bacterium]
MKKLVLATNNSHKTTEIKELLADTGLEILTLADFPKMPPLIEDGQTFRDNALKKARTVHLHSHLPALADDSGLEVFYLAMRPGVRSARYAGENATDEQNNKKLLDELRGVAPRRRGAQFRSVLALVGPDFAEISEGLCRGTIAESPRGTNGFGYDPIFVPDGYTETFAELPSEEKNRISHRAKSVKGMKASIRTRIDADEGLSRITR